MQHYNGTWRKQGRRCRRSRASREPLTWGNVYIQRRRGGASQHLHDTGRECALAQAYLGRVLKQGREHLTLALSRGSYWTILLLGIGHLFNSLVVNSSSLGFKLKLVSQGKRNYHFNIQNQIKVPLWKRKTSYNNILVPHGHRNIGLDGRTRIKTWTT